MTAQELKEFVLDYCDGSIITDRQVNDEHILPVVFMPLVFMDLSEVNTESIGIVYANTRTDTTTGRSVNGWPTFMSCRLMHKKDWELVVPVIQKEIKRRENISMDFQMELEGASDGNRESGANQTLPGFQAEERGRAEGDLRGSGAVNRGNEGGADQEADGTVCGQAAAGHPDSSGDSAEEQR
jgi:hypothetical protein